MERLAAQVKRAVMLLAGERAGGGDMDNERWQAFVAEARRDIETADDTPAEYVRLATPSGRDDSE